MNFSKTQHKPFGLIINANLSGDQVHLLEINDLKTLIKTEHLIVLRGFQTFQRTEDLSNYCEQWGKICYWPFGAVLELVEHDQAQDHIFDSNYVPLHWDGMYRKQIPEFQVFQCAQAPPKGSGGQTTFANTSLALRNSSAKELALWKKVIGTYQRKMEFYDSKTVSPVITDHPFRGYKVIRYNEPPSEKYGHFINPPILDFQGIEEKQLKSFHQSLQNALRSSESFYAHEWHTGDIVISDNFTLLHGREAFVSRAPRHLRRVHVLSDPPFENPGLKAYT